MRKFIHSKFELDLSAYKITDTAENSWFTGTYFAKYSFPFDIALTDEIDVAMGFISHHNSMQSETLFEGIYVHGNAMEKAVLEIEECETSLSATLRYGLEEFPSFNKKLSELGLLKFSVSDIYTHAAGIIGQTWPAVSYNFPQIHIDKIIPEDSDVWFAFEKIINKYVNGAFLENTVDVDEEITYNRNIIQPLPYLLYLLKAGVENAGYVLKGDVLEDEDLKKVLVYTNTEYFKSIAPDSIELALLANEADSFVQHEIYMANIFNRQIDIPQPGRYRINADFIMWHSATGVSRITIKYRDITIYQQITTLPISTKFTLYIDEVFETISDGNPDYLTIYIDSWYKEEAEIVLDMRVNPIILHDNQGEIIPSILNLNEVDLNRAVPDMTFGDLVKVVLALKLMDISPRGNEIWINYIQKEIETRPLINLSDYEKKKPKRKFNKGNSYLLKYQDVDSEDYKYAEVYQDVNGIQYENFVKDEEKTTETIINALPLPLLTRDGVQTAHGFDLDETKPYFVIYDGFVNNLNLSKSPANLYLPYLHANYHQKWNESRLNSQSFTWTFFAHIEELLELNVKSRVFAYKNTHLIKTLQKTEISPDLFEVEIESELHI